MFAVVSTLYLRYKNSINHTERREKNWSVDKKRFQVQVKHESIKTRNTSTSEEPFACEPSDKKYLFLERGAMTFQSPKKWNSWNG